MMIAFIDDSESHSGERRLVLAGYLHRAKQWLAFNHEWGRVLRARPQISHFHMVDANVLAGEFYGWSDKAKDRKVLALANVINGHRPYSFDVSVILKDFEEVYKPIAPYELRNPFHLCFDAVIIKLTQLHVSAGFKTPIDFVFDEKGPIGNEALLWYEALKEDQVPSVKAAMRGAPIFRDDRQVIPLQAADLLAWHVRRAFGNSFTDQMKQTLRVALGKKHFSFEFDRKILTQLARDTAAVPESENTRDPKSGRARLRRIKKLFAQANAKK